MITTGILMIIFLIIFILAILFAIVQYNRLIRLKNQIDEGWAQIDVQLRRRFDLIPNLVETVKGYAAHERETFEKVTQARSAVTNAGADVAKQAEAQNILTGALKSLFAVAEAYPDLKANQNFLALQEELTGTEGKIAYARQYYNDTVMQFNALQQTFPTNVIAGMFGFKERQYFQIEEPAAREPVKVSFTNK
jgi:LemA protein